MAKEEMYSLPKHFYWGYVGPDSIELNWDVEELGEDYADTIELTAVAESKFPLIKIESARFLRGELSLEDLQPDTTYKVTVKALSVEGTVFEYTEVVITPPAGKLVLAFTVTFPAS